MKGGRILKARAGDVGHLGLEMVRRLSLIKGSIKYGR